MKANVGDLEEESREDFLRRLRINMTGMVQEVVGKRRNFFEVIGWVGEGYFFETAYYCGCKE